MDCCDDAACEVEKLRTRQISTLRIVFGINAVMFVAELATGVLAGSVSLVSDSLDMLGDALAYGLSLYVVRRSAHWKARSAMFKGGIMAAFGLAALGQAAYKAWVPHPPGFEAMGLMGTAALVANTTCLGLLWRHRSDDINMQSVWICSRNDQLRREPRRFSSLRRGAERCCADLQLGGASRTWIRGDRVEASNDPSPRRLLERLERLPDRVGMMTRSALRHVSSGTSSALRASLAAAVFLARPLMSSAPSSS